MDSIKADVDGLSAFGSICQRAAEHLAGRGPAAPGGPSFQATSSAVDDVMTTARDTDNLIAVRLRVTGHAVVTAAQRLAGCDSTSRERIATVGDRAVV